ncbi:hypothetical protein HNP55_000795 [Paucibacter oligotrophus]|uniref:O-antigen ligase-like membrane protein n=1 Tax=Roseateles oligotrophus TaxID=1769250 RepID=A0A840L230_9BURK|nr:hypothetical protein [Roseateles oligotrophus]MBB4842300.1 hypothetical protein [Roseateles oligotrophus]
MNLPFNLSPWRTKLRLRSEAKAQVTARGSSRKKAPIKLGLPIFMMIVAVLCGLIMGLGSIQYAILIVAIIVAPLVLLMQSTTLIAWLLVVSMIVAGCLQYFARVEQAHWMPFLILAVMLARVPLDAMRAAKPGERSDGVDLLGFLLIAFVVLVFASALVNKNPPMQALVGVKQYVFPLALTAAVTLAVAPREFWLKVWRSIPWFLIAQLPLCLYQYLFVEKGTSTAFGATGIAWDAVVGSFGGNPEGGGASGALALFLCFGIASNLALLRSQQISPRLAWLSNAAAMASIFLAEVKVVVIFLPLALLILNRAKVLKSAVSAAAWLLATLAFVVGLLLVYQVLHYSNKQTGSKSLSEIFEFATKAEQDTYTYNRETGELSRTGALKTWSQENIGRGRLVESLVGYGPAASKGFSSMFGKGTVARKYVFQLQTSSASTVLWDLGVVGGGLVAAIFVLAFVRSLSLAKRLAADPPLSALAESCAVAIALTGSGYLYNNASVNVSSVQLLASLAIGMVFVLTRFAKKQAFLPAVSSQVKVVKRQVFRPRIGT